MSHSKMMIDDRQHRGPAFVVDDITPSKVKQVPWTRNEVLGVDLDYVVYELEGRFRNVWIRCIAMERQAFAGTSANQARDYILE